ncbi:MAG: DUF1232 domain-containing protein [Gemmatimonadota bacterium]
MNLDEVRAVIDSAKARGSDPLERLIERRMPEATDEERAQASAVALEIIDSIPVFLARASQEARERNMAMLVQPLLDHAEEYFLRPIDLLPEMTHGLAGLLDDAYLVLRILQNLDRGATPFLDWDLEYPIAFIRRLLGEPLSRKLDAVSLGVMHEITEDLSELWRHMAYDA